MVIGIDLGATNIHAGILERDGTIVEEKIVPAHYAKGKRAVLTQLIDIVKVFHKEFPRIRKMGLVCAGPMDRNKGTLLYPTNFKSWGVVPVVDILKEATGLEVAFDNDATAAALAEGWIGKARGLSTFMAVTLGTGVGTGVVLHNKVHRSTTGGSEWGHLIMAKEGLYRCGCGNMGCIETCCSATALVYLAKEYGLDVPSAEGVCALARKQNKIAIDVLGAYSRLLAKALYNYIIILNPEMIILGGGLSNSSEVFLPHAKNYLKDFLKWRKDIRHTEIVTSHFPHQAGVIGAAYICLNDVRMLGK